MADHSTLDKRSAIQGRRHKSGAVLPSSAAPTLCGTGCPSNGQFQFGGLSELEMMRASGETARMSQRRSITRTLRLTKPDGFIQLTIKDDGIGFDPDLPAIGKEREGLGLLRMRERAASAGGALSVKSAPQDGTEIEVRIPLPLKAPQ